MEAQDSGEEEAIGDIQLGKEEQEEQEDQDIIGKRRNSRVLESSPPHSPESEILTPRRVRYQGPLSTPPQSVSLLIF